MKDIIDIKDIEKIERIENEYDLQKASLLERKLRLMIKENPDLERTPFGMHAVVKGYGDEVPPGVIYILKNINDEVNINNTNLLHPFYIVYVNEDGKVFYNHLAVVN